MFKVAAVCIDTSSESLPESKDGFIAWLLRQISPYDFQHRLEFFLVLGLGLVDSVPFQHCPPDLIVKRVEIRRVRWPLNLVCWQFHAFLRCSLAFFKLFIRTFITFERIN